MTFGQRLALNIAPLLLRLGLAFVFIYYGTSKLFYADMPVQGEDAAYLANAGLIKAPPRPASGPTPLPSTEKSDAPSARGPGVGPILPLASRPAFALIRVQNTEKPSGEKPNASEPTANDPKPTPEPEPNPASTPDSKPAPAAQPPASQSEPEPAMPGDVEPTEASAAPTAPAYSAEDFTEPVRVHRLLGLVLAMHHASQEGQWPHQLSSPLALRVLAWTAALAEFLGGWLILLGFLTRVWALGFVGTMCVAMWLTQIAPNIGADHALLGFLPPLEMADAQKWGSWQTWHFQMVLLLSSLAVVLTGPGRVSLDAMLFRRPERDARPQAASDEP